MIGILLLPDIGTILVKILKSEHFEETVNKAVYFYSTAISKRLLTCLATKVTGINFGSIKDSYIFNLKVNNIVCKADKRLAKEDKSTFISYYFPMIYSKGYSRTKFKELF